MEALQRCFITVRAISERYANEFESALRRDRVAKYHVNRDKDAEKFVSEEMHVRAGQSFGVLPEEVIALW